MAKGQAMYRCIVQGGAFVEIKGTEVHVNFGDLVREGHPLLKALPEGFALADDVVRFDVESATAAPGEKRGG